MGSKSTTYKNKPLIGGNDLAQEILDRMKGASNFTTLSELGKPLGWDLDAIEQHLEAGINEEEYNVLMTVFKNAKPREKGKEIPEEYSYNVTLLLAAAAERLAADYKAQLEDSILLRGKHTSQMGIVENDIKKSIIFNIFDKSVMNPHKFCEVQQRVYLQEIDDEIKELKREKKLSDKKNDRLIRLQKIKRLAKTNMPKIGV